MKKVISLILVALLLTATCSVAFSAYSVVDEGAISAKEAVEAFEEESGDSYTKARVYFQMPNGKNGPIADDDVMVHRVETDPETGELIREYDETFIEAGEKTPSWFCDYNILPADGKHYAGIYWWDSGIADPSAWAGYRMEIENEEMGIYYVDLPCSEDLTTIIFNNGVDGGMDSTKEIYPWAYQTADLNCEGATDDYDTLPYGSPNCNDDSDLAYSFNQCIAVVNPNTVTVQTDSGRLQAGVDWYVYYGNGCYGMYYEGCDEYTGNVDQDCCNPDHFVNGVHVGFHEDETVPETEPETEPVHVHTPGEPVRENEVPATYTSAGSYDEVVYCTECGEEISRVTKTIDQLVFTPDPDTLYFDTNGTGWDMGTKGKISFQIFGGDLGTEANPSTGSTWGGKKYLGTAVAGMNGVFSFKPSGKGITLNDGVQYKIIFGFSKTGTGAIDGGQTYDLLFTTDCLGHIAYCDGTEYENPVDSSKKALAAFWRDMDAANYGPVLQVSSIGNVVGTCPEEGKTPESIFVDFLTVVNEKIKTTGLENARKYVVDVGTKTEQKLIDDIGEGLQLTKQQVFDAFYNNEVETVWDYTASTLPGEVVIPHTHTPGEPVQENVVNATCTQGGSYDEVVYCSDPECHEELSRETKYTTALGHNMTFNAEIPATEQANGTKAHYVCSRCNKKFLDEEGTQEVTDAQLIIPMLAHTHTPGTAVQENLVPATCKAAGSYDEVVYCTSCHAELSRTQKTINKLAHTPGNPVQENVVVSHDSTSYNSVVYCTVCNEKISSEKITENVITHTLTFVPKVDSTYDAEGMEAHYECSGCTKLFADASGTVEVTRASLIIPKKERPIEGLLGDVNNDGEVDIVDVTLIQRIDIDIITPDAGMKARADVDKSGFVEITDATRVQRWLVGLNENFGIGLPLAV